MRYLIWKPETRVSRWMSEARRWRALKMVVSTRRTMGASSLSVRRSRSSTSSSMSSSRRTWTLRASPASSRTFWPLSDFFSTSWIWAWGAPAKRRGRLSWARSRSWVTTSRGSAMASQSDAGLLVHRHEVVLEHQVQGDCLEEGKVHGLLGEIQGRVEGGRLVFRLGELAGVQGLGPIQGIGVLGGGVWGGHGSILSRWARPGVDDAIDGGRPGSGLRPSGLRPRHRLRRCGPILHPLRFCRMVKPTLHGRKVVHRNDRRPPRGGLLRADATTITSGP